jgi:hypothetical protein
MQRMSFQKCPPQLPCGIAAKKGCPLIGRAGVFVMTRIMDQYPFSVRIGACRVYDWIQKEPVFGTHKCRCVHFCCLKRLWNEIHNIKRTGHVFGRSRICDAKGRYFCRARIKAIVFADAVSEGSSGMFGITKQGGFYEQGDIKFFVV